MASRPPSPVNRPARRLALATWLTAAATPALIGQQERWTLTGLNEVEKFGRSVLQLGDVNGDGVPDWAAGVPLLEDGGSRSGYVRVYSGATGASLREFTHDAGPSFGAALANAGDRDADGIDDLLVGAPSAHNRQGSVYVVSASNGAILQTFDGLWPIARFGMSVANLGDVDGDSVPDYLVGSPDFQSVSPFGFGKVDLLSGASGALLRSWLGRGDTTRLGSVVASAGDFDADGLEDVAHLELNGLSTVELQVRVYSSATGAILMNDALTPAGALQGFSAATVSDMDGDGRRDLLVAGWSDGLFGLWGGAAVFGSATAKKLFNQVDSNGGFGLACSGVGDITGDGIGDYAVSRPTSRGGAIDVFSGADRSLLHAFTINNFAGGAALSGGVDHNGDGVGDLLIGAPPTTELTSGGKAQLRSLAAGATLKEKSGRDTRALFSAGASFFDDVDGDGLAELLVAAASSSDPLTADAVSVRSGADGSELALFAAGSRNFGGTLITIPDADGDGTSDFAVAAAGDASAVEVRSGATGALIRAITDTRTQISFGKALAAVLQPTGAVHLAIGSPLSDSFRTDAGEVMIVNLSTGALVATTNGNFASEQYGSSIVAVGDVNNDGTVDWAVAAPLNGRNASSAGRVNIINGKTGGQLKVVLGTGAGDMLGSSLALVPDQDADGVSELLIGVPFTGASDEGELRVYSGKTVALLATYVGPLANGNVGLVGAGALDANGDGIGDVMGALAGRLRFDLANGASGKLLRPIFPSFLPERLLTTPAWLAAKNGGGDGPLLAVHAPNDATGGFNAGAIALIELDDFYLQLSPESAAAGVKVTAFTRGGPPGSVALLALEEVNGTPLFVTLLNTALDASGTFSVNDTVPAGLAGTTWGLRSWCVGFDGKLADTQLEELVFE
ncbi:MAG: hypothetical protein FJ293_09220 [Planctomycetes bacterium]|nr:hypothetical protein [Planctomycetota bacterium]